MRKQGWAGFPRAKRVRLMAGSVNPGKLADSEDPRSRLRDSGRPLYLTDKSASYLRQLEGGAGSNALVSRFF